MKKLVLFSCLLLTLFSTQAQKEKIEAYINSYKELAMEEMLRTGVPASITLAQGILESQWGESELVKNQTTILALNAKQNGQVPKPIMMMMRRANASVYMRALNNRTKTIRIF